MSKFRALASALATLPLAALALSTTGIEAASAKEVTVKILKVKALDQPDQFSKGDFYARVTIDGDTTKTEPIKQNPTIEPNWSVSKQTSKRNVNVKVEILDKDVQNDDPIDVNRLDNKRDLDFSVDTKRCRVEGFASTYKCNSKISRAGKEKKAAEVTFTVNVK